MDCLCVWFVVVIVVCGLLGVRGFLGGIFVIFLCLELWC